MKPARNPWWWFLSWLVFELWLLRQIPETVLSDSGVARKFVAMMAHVMPVIHQLDRISSKPEVFAILSRIVAAPLVTKGDLDARTGRPLRDEDFVYMPLPNSLLNAAAPMLKSYEEYSEQLTKEQAQKRRDAAGKQSNFQELTERRS